MRTRLWRPGFGLTLPALIVPMALIGTGPDAIAQPAGASGQSAASQPAAKAKAPPARVRSRDAMKPVTVKNRATDVRRSTDAGDTFVGPPAPGAAGAVAKPAQRANAGIPEPTVVLKPGEVPGIRFDTPIYDFGRIKSGPDVTHDYYFTNTGNGPLEILRVKPS